MRTHLPPGRAPVLAAVGDTSCHPGSPQGARRPATCPPAAHREPNAVALVYIAAFGLDEGETIGALLAQGPATPALVHLDIDARGFAWLPEDNFVNHFAGDIDPVKARVMFSVQQPLHASTLEDVMGVPAWRDLPSWSVVAGRDEAIPPAAEQQFAERMRANTVQVQSGHVAMVSHPDETVNLIEAAAKAPVAV
jgi:pimeloyl-ACP methyl ester carboxylesterase